MAKSKKTLKSQFDSEHGARWESLETARECSRLTKPWVLPKEGHQPGQELPQNFQSIGARGINNLEGLIVTALFPPLLPWFKSSLSAKILYDESVSLEFKEEWSQRLFLRDLVLQSALESAGNREELRGRQTGFRTSKRRSISQLLITGDTLEYMDDEYRIHVIRRDHYVTCRDSSGEVMHHLILARKDPLALSNDQLAAVELKRDDIEEKDSGDRLIDLITKIEWHPQSKRWVIEQEMNAKPLPLTPGEFKSEEKVSPFFSTALDLVDGEHYGHGLVEMNKGDLLSFDVLRERSLDWAGLASKMVPVIDDNSMTREKDLSKPSGVPIRSKVAAGVPQEIGFLSVNKLGDWGVMRDTMGDIRTDLSKSMLDNADSVRDSERTTAFEVQRVTIKQAEGALGGFYAPIADCQQLPVVRRTELQALKDKLVTKLPDKAVEVHILTGISALARSAKVGELLGIAQAAQALGPEAISKIDTRVLLDVLARYQNIYEPGVIKTNAQVDAERQQAAAAAVAQQAMGQAIETTGTLVEQAAGQPIRR